MNDTVDITPSNGAPPAGTTQRESFGSTELARQTETASTAVAEQARAMVEARYVMAIRRPRDIDEARVKLLKACKRPGFAKVARYSKPVGQNKVEGPSVRFAEEALRAMGNVAAEPTVIYDDAEKRIVRVSVTDLEANLTHASEVVIEKTVERKVLRKGQQALGERVNSYGDKVYIVRATEDDLLNKVNALVSKALRTNGLRIVPGDIVEEAMAQVLKTQRDEDARDPDAARKAVADAFASIGVTPPMLAQYLGHDLGSVSPVELADLRAVFAAIKDGEASWKDVMEQKSAGAASGTVTPPKRKSEGNGDATPTDESRPLFWVKDVQVSHSKPNDTKKWTRYAVTLESDAGSVVASTFDVAVGGDALEAKKSGLPVHATIEKKGDHTNLLALEVVRPQTEAREPGSDDDAQGLPGVK